MKGFQKIVLIGIPVILVVLLFLIFQPVPPAVERNCYKIKGMVENVLSPCCEDVRLVLREDDRSFHINRGLERGIDLAEWREELIGKEVELKAIRRTWTPLDPKHKLTSVAEVCIAKGVYFSVMVD